MRLFVTLQLALCMVFLTSCQTPDAVSPAGTSAKTGKVTSEQKGLALKSVMSGEQRIFDVAFPIIHENVPYCPKTTKTMGLLFWNASNVSRIYGKEYEGAANVDYGLGDMVEVRGVIAGSPGHQAGILNGDKVVAVGGKQVPLGRKGIGMLVDVTLDAKEPQIEITFSRSGEEFTKTVAIVEICDYDVVFEHRSGEEHFFVRELRDYFADGSIVVSAEMLRFVGNDDKQLAVIIAHELAHASMKHINIYDLPSALPFKVMLSGVVKAKDLDLRVFGEEHELEADHVAMYYLARAGYDTSSVADFWRNMENAANRTFLTLTKHPVSPERFKVIEKTHAQIVAKIEKGEKLVPNLKGQ